MSEMKERHSTEENCMSRRKLLKTAGCAGAAALLVGSLSGKAGAALSDEKTYPQVRVANIRDLRAGRSLNFDYPLKGRKNILIDMGCAVEGGVGPKGSIVAYSMFCSHLGCGVDLDRESGNLICECHQTIYDPKQSGRVIEGPAPTSLPQIFLDVDGSTGDIYAVGVAGLIYGLRNNLLDGEEVR
ncbi:MAG: arsenate reductase (azurin) small subunit [Candidatus Aenigmarchaeota archaeon]|nr:arsenate reductase (azurin) small subunit [Candidatus Aenigmarchaeota archaeon]